MTATKACANLLAPPSNALAGGALSTPEIASDNDDPMLNGGPVETQANPLVDGFGPLPGEPAQSETLRRMLAEAEAARARGRTPEGIREAGRQAVDALEPPPAQHPYAQHVQRLRARLEARGLPTSAEGVRVFVVDTGEHGDAVARTIAGPVGLAQGAELGIVQQKDYARRSPLTPDEQLLRDDSFHFEDRLRDGELSMEQAVQAGARMALGVIERMRESLARVRELLPQPPDGKPTLVNMSWGTSPARLAEQLTEAVIRAPEGSPLRREVACALGHAPTDQDRGALLALFGRQLTAELAGPQSQTQIATAKQALATELAQARGEGVVVFAAAGNDYRAAVQGGDPSLSRSITHDVAGLIDVGALRPGTSGLSGATEVAEFTAEGDVALSAPGVGIPVGRGCDDGSGPFCGGPSIVKLLAGNRSPGFGRVPQAKPPKPETVDLDGSSYASPYALSVAALMVKAHPAITPDQLERVLLETAHDLADTTRDGAGGVDEVAAVEVSRVIGETARQRRRR